MRKNSSGGVIRKSKFRRSIIKTARESTDDIPKIKNKLGTRSEYLSSNSGFSDSKHSEDVEYILKK
jgi:hypothetical protein